MLHLLGLVPLVPLVSFVLLAFLGRRLSRGASTFLGVGSVGLSALIVLGIAFQFLTAPPPGHVFVQTFWTWIEAGGFHPAISFYLDALSLTMIFVITFVGFLIHLYSSEYMEGDEGYSRFFAYMNLFVGSMLILVLADNLLLMFLGWEGVGLCSYLLIGFWYKEPANGSAARKAFIVTRVGDAGFTLGLFLLFSQLGTLNIQEAMGQAKGMWPVGTYFPVLASALLLMGALGKSAQLPLQTWLPDAMAGPTPVSALIHAATMVTAGVYLIARTHVLFALAPVVQTAVAVIGALTLLLAGCSALTQRDIKRVLAYSTISQLGYMFLALGVGAWSAAIFHLVTHAFFKALLFLGAGAVIIALHHEQDLFKMGGLRKKLPVTFWTFLAGSASLAALPFITAGFYSKDLILECACLSKTGGAWLWAAGLVGAFLTSLYTFRMVFLAFFGTPKTHVSHPPKTRMLLPLVILAFLSLTAGFVEWPHTLGHFTLFSDWMHTALPTVPLVKEGKSLEGVLQLVAMVVSLLGIYLAYMFYIRSPRSSQALARSGAGAKLHRFWFKGWGFDTLYDEFIVQPFVWMAQVNKKDCVDWIPQSLAELTRCLHVVVRGTQTGRLRWYAMGLALGALLVIAFVVFL